MVEFWQYKQETVRVKLVGGEGLTYINEIEFSVPGLKRTTFCSIPISSNCSTFYLQLQNTSYTPVVLKEGMIIGTVSKAIFGTCACIFLNKDMQKLFIQTNVVNKNMKSLELSFDCTKYAPQIKNPSDISNRYSFLNEHTYSLLQVNFFQKQLFYLEDIQCPLFLMDWVF